MVRITSSRSWMAAALLALVVASALTWGVFGSLATRVTGLGIILPTGGEVFSASTESGGRVTEVRVKTGDPVSTGDVLFVVSVGDDEREVRAARGDLGALRSQFDLAKARSDSLVAERKKANADLVASYRNKIDTLNRRLRQKQAEIPGLEQELQEGYITRDTVDQARSQIDDLRFQIVDLRESIADANVQLAEFIAAQIQSLASQEWEVRRQEIDLERLLSQSQEDETVTSPIDGVVVEVAAHAGDQLERGQQAVHVLAGQRSLAVESFFRASDGKRIQPGLRALISVSSAEASVYGTAIGEVVEVSRLPVSLEFIAERLGDQDLAREMMADGPPIYVLLRFVDDPSTTSGLAWSSSSGPPFGIDAGTMALPTVTVASRPPINYVAPILPERIGLSQASGG